jgi:hypothetical protein
MEPDEDSGPELGNTDDLAGATREKLGTTLLDETLLHLAGRVRSKKVTAAELNVALQAIKHLGINIHTDNGVPKPGTPGGKLAGALTDSLPFAGGDAPHSLN